MEFIKIDHKKTITALLVGASLAMAALPAFAADRWELSLGGGAFVSNAYVGSDERYAAPLPYLRGAYAAGKVEFSISSLDGLMVQYLDMDRRFMASLIVNAGGSRDSDAYSILGVSRDHDDGTARLLADSPTAWNPANAGVLLGWISPVGVLGGALYYMPTILSGDADEFFNAFIASLVYLAPIRLSDRMRLTALFTLDFMDQSFADAWYTVETATPELDEFRAGAGIDACQLILMAEYRFTKHIGASFLAKNQFLLGDAAASPYTRSAYQVTAGAYVSYTFATPRD